MDELELRAVLSALQSFPVTLEHKVIRVHCDNTVAVAYINHMGGRIPRLDRIAQTIWQFLEVHNAFLIATYISQRMKIPRMHSPADSCRLIKLEISKCN